MRLSDYVYCPCVVIKNKVKHDTIFTQLLKRVILVKSLNAIFSCILKFHQKKSAWEKVCNLNRQKCICIYMYIYEEFRRRQWHPTPVLLPGKSRGWRSLVGCSPWGWEELDTTERLHFYFSLSCIGEGTGNPLKCSCLENPRDRGAWWAAIYGVAQSRTRLKWLSNSSSMKSSNLNGKYEIHICKYP